MGRVKGWINSKIDLIECFFESEKHTLDDGFKAQVEQKYSRSVQEQS